MAFLPAVLPYLAAGSAAYGAAQSSISAAYNSKVDANTRDASINQAAAQEGIVRRMGREALGKQTAAFGAAGVGYGGSSETSLDQSAVNQELDALNTRYKGATTGYGYGVESGIQKSQSNQYGVMAGAALLKGLGSNYSYAPKQPSTEQANPGLGPG
jgi:hypothetical protein